MKKVGQFLVKQFIESFSKFPGIGKKTAAELINRFKTLDNLFNNIEKIEQTKRREKIENHKNDAYISKKLVTLKKDVSVKKNVKNFTLKNFDPKLAIDFLNELEFKKLSDRISSKYKVIQKNTKKSFIENSSKNLQQQLKGINVSMENAKQVIKKDLINPNIVSTVKFSIFMNRPNDMEISRGSLKFNINLVFLTSFSLRKVSSIFIIEIESFLSLLIFLK